MEVLIPAVNAESIRLIVAAKEHTWMTRYSGATTVKVFPLNIGLILSNEMTRP